MKLREILRDAQSGQIVTLDVAVSVANLGSLGGPGLAARGLTITDGDTKWKLWVSSTFPVSPQDGLKLDGPFKIIKVLGMRQIYPSFETGAVVRNTTKGIIHPPPSSPSTGAPRAEPQVAAPVVPQIVIKETIREIVKVPCRFCGALNVNTDVRCFSCGALTK